jgi:hypothetical protein
MVTSLADELSKTKTIKQGGKTVKMTLNKIVAMQLVNDLVSGRPIDRARTLKLLASLGVVRAEAEVAQIREEAEKRLYSTGWTPEMEAALLVIDAEFLEGDRER